jgi:cytoskeletal protein CcmA (bactofilin family)
VSTPTQIANGHTIVGVLRAGEDLSIAGHVKGRIESEGVVIVEAGGIVEADVRARELIVRGIVVGDVASVDGVEVTANGQVLGSVTTRRVLMRAGGRILGEVSTGVDVQGFVYPERVAAAAQARRGTGTIPQARPAGGAIGGGFESAFGNRVAGDGDRGTSEGARSWMADHVVTTPATVAGRRPEPTPEEDEVRPVEPAGERG